MVASGESMDSGSKSKKGSDSPKAAATRYFRQALKQDREAATLDKRWRSLGGIRRRVWLSGGSGTPLDKAIDKEQAKRSEKIRGKADLSTALRIGVLKTGATPNPNRHQRKRGISKAIDPDSSGRKLAPYKEEDMRLRELIQELKDITDLGETVKTYIIRKKPVKCPPGNIKQGETCVPIRGRPHH